MIEPLQPAVEALVRAGAVLDSALWPRLFALRWLGLAAVAAGAWRVHWRTAAALLAAFAGQASLLGGEILLGAALYAAAIVLYARRASVAPCSGPRWPRGAELAVGGAALVLYAVLATHRIDVYPDLYFDEVAYLRTVRMHLGALAPGPILTVDGRPVYTLAQFRAQPVPLWLQALVAGEHAPALVRLRLLSAGLVGAALAVAAAALRARAGPVLPLGMLALAAASPLVLVYARTGLYIAASVLHGALCFAALGWLARSFHLRAAAVVGVLLGGSLYFYQLSWFVPLLALAWALVTPSLHHRSGGRRIAACTLLVALATALPGLLCLRDGLAAVSAQTFDRALWSRVVLDRPPDRRDAALVVAEAEADLARFGAELRERGLVAGVAPGSGGRQVLLVQGEPDEIGGAVAAAEARGWRTLRDPWASDGLVSRVRRSLAQLFYAPSPESAGRWVDAPLVAPLLAPLLVLGLADVARRPGAHARLLLVWVAGGALLPALVGGVYPRRFLLMLPFAQALMVLPLLALGAGLSGRARGLLGAALALGLGAAIACQAHLYFARWDQRFDVRAHDRGPLAFLHVLEALPPDEAVLLPDLYTRYQLDAVREELPRSGALVEREDADTLRRARAASCAQPTPFTWVTLDDPGGRALSRALEPDFVVRRESRDAFLLTRVVVRKQGGCRGIFSP